MLTDPHWGPILSYFGPFGATWSHFDPTLGQFGPVLSHFEPFRLPLSAFEPILTHAAGIWWHTGPKNTANTPKLIPNLAANGAFRPPCGQIWYLAAQRPHKYGIHCAPAGFGRSFRSAVFWQCLRSAVFWQCFPRSPFGSILSYFEPILTYFDPNLGHFDPF